MSEVQINLEELITWDDEKCKEFDKQSFIPSIITRDLAKKLKKTLEEYKVLFIEDKQIKDVLKQGDMDGYAIVCPDCKVQYTVKPDELNYDVEITCQDCGAHYVQNKNIFGIHLREKGE